MDPHPVDDDGNVDLFRYINTSLQELFQRQQIHELLGDNEELAVHWDQIHTIIQQQLEEHRRNCELGFWHYFGIVYIMGVIPLPTFQYQRYWRHRQRWVRHIVHYVGRITSTVHRYSQYIAQVVFFALYFHSIVMYLFPFANLATFSNSFLQDSVSYMFRASQPLLERHSEIAAHGDDIFFFVNDDTGLWRFLVVSIYNLFARTLAVVQTCDTCGVPQSVFELPQSRKGALVYRIRDQSLVFRFSRVICRYFGMSGWPLTALTLGIYTTYALVSWSIGVNVVIFFMFKMVTRWMGMGGFYGVLGNVLRRQMGTV